MSSYHFSISSKAFSESLSVTSSSPRFGYTQRPACHYAMDIVPVLKIPSSKVSICLETAAVLGAGDVSQIVHSRAIRTLQPASLA